MSGPARTPTTPPVPRSRRPGRARSAGFTLVELMIAVAIVGVLASIGGMQYFDYIERVRVARSIIEIDGLQGEIDAVMGDAGIPPVSFAAVGIAPPRDPWGNVYRYLPLRDARGRTINRGRARKDRFLVPINSDYDLYSMGADGASVSPLTAAPSRDDVVRANDGGFIGLADRY